MYRWAIGMIAGLMLSGCSAIGAEGIYHPTGIPLQVSINTWGEINFEVETGINIPTPIGVFEANIVLDPAREFNKDSTLTIRFDGHDHIYDLHGNDFNVSFQPGYYEEINISKAENNIILELKPAEGSGSSSEDTGEAAPSQAADSSIEDSTSQANVTASYPAANDLDEMPSIWIINNIPALDLPRPGRRSYNITVTSMDELLWPYFWCTSTEEILQDNLRYTTLEFLIDGEKVSNALIRQYSEGNSDWKCTYWATVLSQWRRGEVVHLEIEYTFSKDVDDGYNVYPAGTYVYALTVSVK